MPETGTDLRYNGVQPWLRWIRLGNAMFSVPLLFRSRASAIGAPAVKRL